MSNKVAVEITELTAALNAAKKLGVKNIGLLGSKEGLLFASFTEASVYIRRISKEKMNNIECLVELERIVSATQRAKDVAIELTQGMVNITLKGNNSKIQLSAEKLDPAPLLKVWQTRSEGKPARQLSKLLTSNSHMLTIKDNVTDKPIPVHIRWNSEGVVAGMSDNYHGIAIYTDKAPKSKDKAREIFVYSEWLSLLIEYLNEKANLSISERSIVVSSNEYLLSLQAIVPSEDTVTLSDIDSIMKQDSSAPVKISMDALNQSVKRSLAVLSKEDNLTLITDEKSAGYLTVRGSSSSGSKITEKINITSKKSVKIDFSGPVYNLRDVTSSCVPEVNMRMAGRAAIMDFSYAPPKTKDQIYTVVLFMAISS